MCLFMPLTAIQRDHLIILARLKALGPSCVFLQISVIVCSLLVQIQRFSLQHMVSQDCSLLSYIVGSQRDQIASMRSLCCAVPYKPRPSCRHHMVCRASWKRQHEMHFCTWARQRATANIGCDQIPESALV